jgi:ketosteroid isomerase-like protein
MSEENVEIVRALNAAFQAGLERGDFGAVWGTGLVAPDSELLPAPEIEGAVVYRGPEGFVEFMRRWTEDFENWTVRLERLIEAPDGRVVALSHQSAIGKGSGAPVDLDYGAVFELRGGILVRLRLYLDPAQALEAPGLSE